MSTGTVASAAPTAPRPPMGPTARGVLLMLRDGVLVLAALLILAFLLEIVFKPLLASTGIEEDVTGVLSRLLVTLAPYVVYIVVARRARSLRHTAPEVEAAGDRVGKLLKALALAWLVIVVLFALVSAGQWVTKTGPFVGGPSLQFTASQQADGIHVESVMPGGAAEVAGLQVGDVITAIRREEVTLADLNQRVSQAELDDPFRLAVTRGGEALQLTVRVAEGASADLTALIPNLVNALAVGTIAFLIPSVALPYVIVVCSLVPLFLGYAWLIIATFSTRTNGMIPVDVNGNIGGWTLSNWSFLTGADISSHQSNIWAVTFNSMVIAVSMTIASVLISSMAGYALARMKFAGRKTFLSMTLVLHGFPAVTLIIPIFLVLMNLGAIPLLGNLIGFNTTGGIAMVMVAFELPLGIWLMKGFFDNISWDMERSALIDGANRFRTFWEIILPQIRPGLLALGIFSFISGWNAYLIPATYSIGLSTTTLPVYINQLRGELAPVNWNLVAAVGIFQLIPIFLLFIFAQEYLLNIYAGGTKGST